MAISSGQINMHHLLLLGDDRRHLYLLWFLIRNGLPDSASEQVDLEDPENAQP